MRHPVDQCVRKLSDGDKTFERKQHAYYEASRYQGYRDANTFRSILCITYGEIRHICFDLDCLAQTPNRITDDWMLLIQ